MCVTHLNGSAQHRRCRYRVVGVAQLRKRGAYSTSTWEYLECRDCGCKTGRWARPRR